MNSSFDPNQTQWYTAGPAPASPSPEDGEAKRKKWMRIGIASGVGLLALVLVIFFARSAWEGRSSQSVARVQKQTQAADACEDTKNPEKCKAAIPSDLAGDEGDAVYCQDLSGEAKDDCLMAAAVSAKDVSLCAGVSDAQRRTACEDGVATLLVREQGASESLCAIYATESLEQTCVGNYLIALARRGDCTDARITDEMCKEATYTAQAMAARDPSLCDEIDTQQGEAACHEMVGPGDADQDGLDANEEKGYGTNDQLRDTDGDGLTDFEEVRTYLTNPLKADTDGDTFPDGVEVTNGYDALH